MKKPFIFLAAILVFALVVAIIAMVGDSSDDIVGTYVLKDASGSGSEMFKATVTDAELQIDSDHTGTFSMLGQTTPVIVNTEEGKISLDNGVNYAGYVFDGKKLTVEGNGNKLVFKKK